ncbi:MAG: hypothetical protein QXL77_07420 [Candidatus Bathyarchaeia archaeon]
MSYAVCMADMEATLKSYLKKIRGEVVVDSKPFHIHKPPPEISKHELETVENCRIYREMLAEIIEYET